MIRHHDVQDSFSAEAAPMLLASSLTVAPGAVHLAPAVIQSSGYGGFGTMPSHPLMYYAAPLSTLILIVAMAVALLSLMKVAARQLSFAMSPKTLRATYFIKSDRHGYRIRRR
jgi:hypothetical protein